MKLPYLISSQVPEFVLTEYPAFMEFLKAYYTWMQETNVIVDIGNLVDIDNTVDEFVKYFKQQLDVHGLLSKTDDRLLLKNIKELYSSKGTPESFKFFFKIVFGSESSTFTPWDYVFKPSAGEWVQDVAVNIRVIQGDITSYVGDSVYIIDQSGVSHKTYIKSIRQRFDNCYEVFITRFSCGPVKFTKVESYDGTLKSIITNTTVSSSIEKVGAGFEAGQLYNVTSGPGYGSIVKIKSVTSSGGIRAIELIDFGIDYNTDFNILITPQNRITSNDLKSSITINSLLYETNDIIAVQNESGEIVRHDYTNLATQYLNPTYVGAIVAEIQSQTGDAPITDNYASIKFKVGCIYKYSGYYKTSNNILEEECYIQDSYYYQVFSYVTSVDITLSRYSLLLKETLHPAGTEHFGNYKINNVFALTPSAELALNIIARPGGAIRDFIYAPDDSNISFTLNKYMTDSIYPTAAGGIYDITNTNLLYVQVLPDQYWLAGYFENEYPFTEE